MGFSEAYLNMLKNMFKKYQQSEIKEKTGIPQPMLSDYKNGNKLDMRLCTLSKLIDFLSDHDFASFIRDIRPHAPFDVIETVGLRKIDVYDIEGKQDVVELKKSDPVFTLRIPEKFFPSDYGVLMSGHSMEDTYPHQCAIGIREWKRGTRVVAGEDYLCELPFEGLVIRRVLVASEKGSLEFTPLNSDKEHFRPQIFVAEEAEKKIFGRVTWVSHRR